VPYGWPIVEDAAPVALHEAVAVAHAYAMLSCRGIGGLPSWRSGELESWRVGELGSWGVGELGSWGVGG